MIPDFDISPILDAVKYVISAGKDFYGALLGLLLKVWDLIGEVISFINKFVNK